MHNLLVFMNSVLRGCQIIASNFWGLAKAKLCKHGNTYLLNETFYSDFVYTLILTRPSQRNGQMPLFAGQGFMEVQIHLCGQLVKLATIFKLYCMI